MNKITLGPFFYRAATSALPDPQIVPLGLQVEWASPGAAVRIPLFWTGSGPRTLRLDQLLFARRALPFDLDCPAYQVVETENETFLPLDALLAALYERYEVSRSIFQVLAELSSVVTLHSRVRHPIRTPGLLVPHAEARGFCLNTVIVEGDTAHVEIGWQPAGQSHWFHVCIVRFRRKGGALADAGTWLAAGLVGVASVLAREFRSAVPGAPAEAFTPAGLALLKQHIAAPGGSGKMGCVPPKLLYLYLRP